MTAAELEAVKHAVEALKTHGEALVTIANDPKAKAPDLRDHCRQLSAKLLGISFLLKLHV